MQISESYQYLTRQRRRTSRYANLFPHIEAFHIQFEWWTARQRDIEDRRAKLEESRTDQGHDDR